MKLKKYDGNSVNNIVLDTNVLVSGIINPYGNPAKILNLILNGNLIINADARILTEYERVLKSPKFSFPPDQIKILIQFIFHQCSFIVPSPLQIDLIDESDLPFIEVAIHENIPFITGNKKHFDNIDELKIFSPNEFLANSLGSGRDS